MTPREGSAVARHQAGGPGKTPRLRLKPRALITGCVDGAWWPHSTDLVKELPDLLAVLSVRLDAITQVVFNPSEWATAPSKLLTAGREIRLDGSQIHPPGTVEVVGINRKRILLLIVPHQMNPDMAHEAMMAAAAPHNESTVDDLLMISPQHRAALTRADATERRWTAHD